MIHAEPDHDEFRGSMPVMSAKDLLLELRADVKEMRSEVALLSNAGLDKRVNDLEKWRDQLIGKLIASGVAIGVAFTILGLVLDHVAFGG